MKQEKIFASAYFSDGMFAHLPPPPNLRLTPSPFRDFFSERTFYNFKVGGVVLVAIGSWARLERTRFGSFDNLAVDPAIFLIIVGCVMFFISIFGCFGSIRENICLLKCVSTKNTFLAEKKRKIAKYNKIIYIVQGCHVSGKCQGKMKFSPGQGKVREF